MKRKEIEELLIRLGIYNAEDYIGNKMAENIVFQWLNDKSLIKQKTSILEE